MTITSGFCEASTQTGFLFQYQKTQTSSKGGKVPGVTGELPYFGTTKQIPAKIRYIGNTNSLQYKNFRSIVSTTKTVASGVTQVLIELINGGKPYPSQSTQVDNYYNDTNPDRGAVYALRKIAGVMWLNANKPGWTKDYRNGGAAIPKSNQQP